MNRLGLAMGMLCGLGLAACGSSTSGPDGGSSATTSSGSSGGASSSGTSGAGAGASSGAASSTSGTTGAGASSGGTSGGASSGGGTSGGASSGGSASGGNSGGSSGGCQDTGSGCNTLTPGGNAISQQWQAATLPTAVGGTLVDGTYNLTQDIVYTGVAGLSGPTGKTTQITVNFASGTLNLAETNNDGCTGLITTSVSAATTQLTLGQTCPVCTASSSNCLSGNIPYSVTTGPFTLSIFTGQNNGGQEVLTFQ